MRGKRKFGLILLFVAFVVPAYGQGQPADKTITVFGQSIHYFDMGSGPVVVLLHGLGSRKEDWLPVLEPMAQKYRLLVPDQIGLHYPVDGNRHCGRFRISAVRKFRRARSSLDSVNELQISRERMLCRHRNGRRGREGHGWSILMSAQVADESGQRGRHHCGRRGA